MNFKKLNTNYVSGRQAKNKTYMWTSWRRLLTLSTAGHILDTGHYLPNKPMDGQLGLLLILHFPTHSLRMFKNILRKRKHEPSQTEKMPKVQNCKRQASCKTIGSVHTQNSASSLKLLTSQNTCGVCQPFSGHNPVRLLKHECRPLYTKHWKSVKSHRICAHLAVRMS